MASCQATNHIACGCSGMWSMVQAPQVEQIGPQWRSCRFGLRGVAKDMSRTSPSRQRSTKQLSMPMSRSILSSCTQTARPSCDSFHRGRMEGSYAAMILNPADVQQRDRDGRADPSLASARQTLGLARDQSLHPVQGKRQP